MASGLDMSLDDLIKNNKSSSSSSSRGAFRGGRGRSSAPGGPARRFPDRAPTRPSPYSMPKIQATDLAWGHEMFVDPVGRAPNIETGTKLYVSNLDYGVSNEDIKELFSEVGELKKYSINYDKSGRSKGTAEIVFARRGDAVAAVKRYNEVQLDGKPMKIELIGANIPVPVPIPGGPNGPGLLAAPVNGGFRNFNPAARIGQGRGGGMGRPRGGRGFGGGRSFGGGRGRGRAATENVSAADLDAELEKYHAEAMTE